MAKSANRGARARRRPVARKSGSRTAEKPTKVVAVPELAVAADSASSAAPSDRSTNGQDGQESESRAPPFLVAAVGASAGGLEAFSSLLRQFPQDAPLALVLVQHLDPNHPSLLPELLQAKTKLTVEAGRDKLAIEPGHVYVLQPGTHMTVIDGHLRVEPRPPQGSGLERPVDTLFRSVAAQYGDKGVGVVLSGSANDGAAGIQEIKAAGGITIVQRPEEAEIDGMPRAAIATGAVDVVLPVTEIADRLLELSMHPTFNQASSHLEFDLPTVTSQRRRIFHLLRRTTRIDFNKYKTPTVARRIQRRMALHRLSSLGEYVGRLERDPKELERLQKDLLVHVTSFFREPESFAAMASTALPRLLERDRDAPFRVWVPGCSTGEEVYSLAIALLEFRAGNIDAAPLQIFGTDVSDSTIEQARSGVYPVTIATNVSDERLRRFFVPFDGGYRVDKSVRDCCVFARQDVTLDPPFSKLDLVVCRNLLIYLTQATQRKVISVFHYALKPDGFLMLGRSETVGSNADLFLLVDKRFQIYSRKPTRGPTDIEFPAISRLESKPALSDHVSSKPIRGHGPEWDAQTDANRFLLDHYAPPVVVVDSDLRILRSRGVTRPYLELPTGDVSFDILRMVRPELVFGLRSALQRARAHGKPFTQEGLQLKSDGKVRVVDLHVVPVGGPEARQFMILFEEKRRGARKKDSVGGLAKKSKGERPRPPNRGAANRLQSELVESRRQLQSIIDDLAAANEELQSANEEILSSNEELQSTNEELDTAKEELQSTNEELSTLNDELRGRNDELKTTNVDLVNLLGNVQIPIIMVGRDMKIRRFTPAAEKTLNVIPSDVGRPIGHLRPNFSCPDLEALIAQVIDTVSGRQLEVKGPDERLYILQVRPYTSSDNRIDGAVLALFDVTLSRTQETALRLAREAGEAIIAGACEPILVLDGNLRIRSSNRAFHDKFQLPDAETKGRLIYDLGDGGWDTPAFRHLLTELLGERKSFEAFAVEAAFPRPGGGRIVVDGRRIESPDKEPGILLVVRDATGSAP